jgi:hypothetical protein
LAGVVHTVFCLRTWDFSGLQAGAGFAEQYCIRKDLPVDDYREATLLVRVHDADIVNPSSKIEVIAVETAPSPEEPDVDYGGTTLATATVTGTSEPALLAPSFSTPFGGAVTIYVRGTQGSAGTNVLATLSVDLVLKA